MPGGSGVGRLRNLQDIVSHYFQKSVWVLLQTGYRRALRLVHVRHAEGVSA